MDITKETKFDVALSFAGEDRDYVAKVAILLKESGVNVFYDVFDEVNLWGKNLYDYLSDIYQNQAKYTVIFISKHYNEKLWTNYERQSMQARAFEESKEYILPVRFDDTDVKGILKTTGYLDLRTRTPAELAEIIQKKLIQNGLPIPNQLLRVNTSIASLKKRTGSSSINIEITDNEGKPIENATVYCSAANGTFINGKTDINGLWLFNPAVRKLYTVLVSHPNYASSIHQNLDPTDDLNIQMNKSDGIGSIIIDSTGYIPGLQGRLNPILDTNDRMYLYADNISINGGQNQPCTFEIGKSLELEDANGAIVFLAFRFIRGHGTALIDYTKL